MQAWYCVSLPPSRAASVETPTSARQVVLATALVRCATGSGAWVAPPEPLPEPLPEPPVPVMSPTAPPTASPRLETALPPPPPEPPEPPGVPGTTPLPDPVSPPPEPEAPLAACCCARCFCLAWRTLAWWWALLI